ncbi:hypothetical protein MMC25_007057 [Agyrium rufum]|nr:hypothetical protein [Agyrium rufum]
MATSTQSGLSSLIRRGTSFLTGASTSGPSSIPKNPINGSTFSTAPTETALFPVVDPAIDGEDCEHDCDSCTIHYPSKFKIDEEEKLFGQVKGWATHMLVATGKTDWLRDVEDEKGSVMEAVRDCGMKPSNGRLMLSASNIPLPTDHQSAPSAADRPTSVLLLPSFTIVEEVTPASVSALITQCVSTSATNTTPFTPSKNSQSTTATSEQPEEPPSSAPPQLVSEAVESSSIVPSTPSSTIPANPSDPPISTNAPTPFKTRPCPHQYLILLCSQKTRDARCGQSAPLLRREFERHLRPLGLYRDLHDERPGGVGIYFISHVGGHKFSANLMIYRRRTAKALISARVDGAKETGGKREGESRAMMLVDDGDEKEDVNEIEDDGSAAQCIWLARVRPEDCEGIVKYTILQGKVRKPERQLRGGFDREKGVCSW